MPKALARESRYKAPPLISQPDQSWSDPLDCMGAQAQAQQCEGCASAGELPASAISQMRALARRVATAETSAGEAVAQAALSRWVHCSAVGMIATPWFFIDATLSFFSPSMGLGSPHVPPTGCHVGECVLRMSRHMHCWHSSGMHARDLPTAKT